VARASNRSEETARQPCCRAVAVKAVKRHSEKPWPCHEDTMSPWTCVRVAVKKASSATDCEELARQPAREVLAAVAAV